jgi:hypothetical protein
MLRQLPETGMIVNDEGTQRWHAALQPRYVDLSPTRPAA